MTPTPTLPRRRQRTNPFARDLRPDTAPRRRKGWTIRDLITQHRWACEDCTATGNALSHDTADHLAEAHWMAAHGEMAA